MSKIPEGCARPTGKVLGNSEKKESRDIVQKEESVMETAKVGKKAPDFEAPVYFKGKFDTVKLSDYAGKWLLLCFYPGDFTFV